MAQSESDQCTSGKTCAPPRGVVPYVLSPNGQKHVEWMKTVFGATVKCMMMDEKATEKIVHGSLELNGGAIYISDGSCLMEQKKQSALPPGREAVGFVHHLNVSEADAREIWKKAMENDAKMIVDLEKQFWGDIYGSFRDPLGFEWAVCAPPDSGAGKQEEGASGN